MLWVFAIVLAVVGCDPTFEPIAGSDRYFSVFGHLDPALDTQWIRVMPTRSTIFTSAEPNDIVVSLEELRTGRMLDVSDSLFAYPYPFDEALDAGAVHIHNYWTTDPVIPGETYRFRATGPRGTSVADVRVPAGFTVTVGIQQASSLPGALDRVWIDDAVGVESLAFIRVHALLRFPPWCGGGRRLQVLRHDIDEDAPGLGPVIVNKLTGFPIQDCNPQIPERLDLWIVGAGSPWPRVNLTGRSWHPASASFGMIDMPANPDHAVGHLSGVIVKMFPYEDCRIEGPEPRPSYCMLKYDDARAILTGAVRDACTNGPLPDATVRLEETVPDGSGHWKVRPAPSGLLGEYRIASLDAGMPYALTVIHPHPRHMPPPEDTEFPEYAVHTDTLVFQPGEHATLDIALQRLGPCEA